MVKTKFENMDYNAIEDKVLDCIYDYTRDRSVIIGLSGGIDSSIVCALAVNALGNEKVKALIVTNSRYSPEGLMLAREYAHERGLELQEVDTEQMRSSAVKSLKIDEHDVIQTATLDARLCDSVIKTVACMENRIYLGTINSTERLTGWYPKGNLVGDLCPIGGLLKEQVKHLAIHLGIGHLVDTVSEDASRICSGCGELPEFKGIDYQMLDTVLLVYETSPAGELIQNLRMAGIDKKIYSKILSRISQVKHKSDVFPKYCRVNAP